MDISGSVEQFLKDPEQEVARWFYANLFMHDPSVEEKLTDTDLRQQGIHLVMALQVVSRLTAVRSWRSNAICRCRVAGTA